MLNQGQSVVYESVMTNISQDCGGFCSLMHAAERRKHFC
jgi:hypothetical protein